MSKVLRISEAANLALHVMPLLPRVGEHPMPLSELASAINASPAHLSKVLQTLTRAGLANSTRGPQGGFTLTRPPEEITLMEIFEALDGRFQPAMCLFGEPVCQRKECLLADLIANCNVIFQNYLSIKKLSDFANPIQSSQKQ